jgi:hypothetical protein
MAGFFDAGTHQLHLDAGQWLLRPPGFVTVGLAGTLTDDGSVLTGAVAGQGCSTFSLRRLISARACHRELVGCAA